MSSINYKDRMKYIRPFVDFNIDLRKKLNKSEKALISKYYNQLSELIQSRPGYIYKPRSDKYLKAAKEYAHPGLGPKIKIAYLPTSGKEKPRIRLNKNKELLIEFKHVGSKYIKFDKMELIKNTKSYVRKIADKNSHAKSFTVQCGAYEIRTPVSNAAIDGYVDKLAAKYSDNDKNNYFGNWMHGMLAHYSKNQKDINDLIFERSDAARALQKKMKNKRKSDKRNKR